MSAFQYPQHLLHSVIEPQWFPKRKEETESTLTALEAAEEAHAQHLDKMVHEYAPIAGASVIGQRANTSSGLSGGRRTRARGDRTSSASATAPATPNASSQMATDEASPAGGPTTISSSQRFWNRAGSRRSSTGVRTVTHTV